MTDIGSIRDYFTGKHVFITGGTGFIGKVLIEKLLRSCPTIGGIHCLVRPKKGHPPRDRLLAIFQEKMFDELWRSNPSFGEKVHAISGDLLEPAMGISEEDTYKLQSLVNIVIHSAATLKFDEFIGLAIEMNVLGVRKILAFVRGVTNLEVFLHVSTAYANCDRKDIDEVFYPPKTHPNKVVDLLSWMDDETIGELTDRLIGDKPNTYTYTKQLAEWVLMEEGQGLPLAIVRPSIVTGAMAQPMPGWVDNWNGPSGLYMALGKGYLKTMRADRKATADIVPVDLLVNAMIAIVWSSAQTRPSKIPIYNITTGGLNPIKWGQMEILLLKALDEVPYDDAIGVPGHVLTKNGFRHSLNMFMYHKTPAFIFDLILRMVGKKPKATRLYEKIHKSMSVLDYFTLNTWNWSNANTMALHEALQPEDKEIFYFDPRAIEWSDYVLNYAKGIKSFVLKENVKDMSKARSRINRLIFMNMFLKTVGYVLALKILMSKSDVIKVWLLSILELVKRKLAVLAKYYS